MNKNKTKLNIIKNFIKKHSLKREHISYEMYGYLGVFGIKYTDMHKILSRLYPDGYSFINKDNTIMHYKDGHLHRDGDRPSIISEDGYISYWKNGMIHRENGPAIIYSNGGEKWMKHDKALHKKPIKSKKNRN